MLEFKYAIALCTGSHNDPSIHFLLYDLHFCPKFTVIVCSEVVEGTNNSKQNNALSVNITRLYFCFKMEKYLEKSFQINLISRSSRFYLLIKHIFSSTKS